MQEAPLNSSAVTNQAGNSHLSTGVNLSYINGIQQSAVFSPEQSTKNIGHQQQSQQQFEGMQHFTSMPSGAHQRILEAALQMAIANNHQGYANTSSSSTLLSSANTADESSNQLMAAANQRLLAAAQSQLASNMGGGGFTGFNPHHVSNMNNVRALHTVLGLPINQGDQDALGCNGLLGKRKPEECSVQDLEFQNKVSTSGIQKYSAGPFDNSGMKFGAQSIQANPANITYHSSLLLRQNQAQQSPQASLGQKFSQACGLQGSTLEASFCDEQQKRSLLTTSMIEPTIIDLKKQIFNRRLVQNNRAASLTMEPLLLSRTNSNSNHNPLLITNKDPTPNHQLNNQTAATQASVHELLISAQLSQQFKQQTPPSLLTQLPPKITNDFEAMRPTHKQWSPSSVQQTTQEKVEEIKNEIIQCLPVALSQDTIFLTQLQSSSISRLLLDYFVHSELSKQQMSTKQQEHSCEHSNENVPTGTHSRKASDKDQQQQQQQQLMPTLKSKRKETSSSSNDTNDGGNNSDNEAVADEGILDDVEDLKQQSNKVMLITKCPHTSRKHYAKNMCSSCYRKYGRSQNASRCPHPERMLYSMGMCQTCYLADYHKRRCKTSRGGNEMIATEEAACMDEEEEQAEAFTEFKPSPSSNQISNCH